MLSLHHTSQDGATTTGVSVLYSVKRMDAGPILAQAPFEVRLRVRGGLRC